MATVFLHLVANGNLISIYNNIIINRFLSYLSLITLIFFYKLSGKGVYMSLQH